MLPAEIAERAKRIRLPLGDIADLTGLSVHTVGRTLSARTEPLQKTANRISEAVLAEEIRLLEHLAKLHPERVRLVPEQEAAE